MEELDKQMALESLIAGIIELSKELDEIENKSKTIVSDERCKQAAQVVEDKIESSPNPVETAETIAPGAENIKEEAEQINDGNPHNVEVNNEKVEQDIDSIIDNDDTVVDENAPQVNEADFVKSDILPYADNVLELKQEEPLPVDDSLSEQVVDEQSIIDNGLEDQNQYADTIELEPEEKETVTEAIEEAAPEEDRETYFGMLGIPHRGLSSSNSVSLAKDETYKIDKLDKAGSAILGNLNNALPTSSGSVSASNVGDVDKSAKPMTSEIANSAGGSFLIKGPTESANAEVGSKPGNSNNGFATSNGGNISSGPVDKSGLKTSQHNLPGNTLHTAEVNSIDLSEASKEALKAAIIKLDDKIAAENDIDKEALKYKGISIDDLPPELINELWGILNG